MKKPPLGLQSRYIWLYDRIHECILSIESAREINDWETFVSESKLAKLGYGPV